MLDPIHNGRSISFQNGSNRLVTATVASGGATTCVPASRGTNTLTTTVLNAASEAIAPDRSRA